MLSFADFAKAKPNPVVQEGVGRDWSGLGGENKNELVSEVGDILYTFCQEKKCRFKKITILKR